MPQRPTPHPGHPTRSPDCSDPQLSPPLSTLSGGAAPGSARARTGTLHRRCGRRLELRSPRRPAISHVPLRTTGPRDNPPQRRTVYRQQRTRVKRCPLVSGCHTVWPHPLRLHGAPTPRPQSASPGSTLEEAWGLRCDATATDDRRGHAPLGLARLLLQPHPRRSRLAPAVRRRRHPGAARTTATPATRTAGTTTTTDAAVIPLPTRAAWRRVTDGHPLVVACPRGHPS